MQSILGKSTIFKVLQRVYDPTNGKILLDGQDIHQMNVDQFRRCVSVVGQEPKLFDLSVKENILYGLDENIPNQV